MSFWNKLDITGDNFLGMGSTLGRIMAGIQSAGGSEMHRTDPFATKQGTWENQLGRSFGGFGPGAVGGFITGGPYGAAAGGATGAIMAGTGNTNNSTLSGFGENFGAGLGGGALAGYASGSGLAGSLGGGGGGGALAGGSGGGGAGSTIAKALSASGGMGGGGGGGQGQSAPTAKDIVMQMYLKKILGNLMPGGGSSASA